MKRPAQIEEPTPDIEEQLSRDDTASRPADTGDPNWLVEAKIPPDIRQRYEIHSYRNAATILSETKAEEFQDLLKALRTFEITTTIIRTAGGNESQVPKLISKTLRPLAWYETVVQGDLVVTKSWREPGVTKRKKGAPAALKNSVFTRKKYIDGHKIDYVKGRVAFDLEWNSKDQTFDRDLYAFSSFFLTGVIDVAVLLTRSAELDEVFRGVGPALKKDGVTLDLSPNGRPRTTLAKYGASTTWMGKLLYRLNAGRNGGCPVLAIGITPRCVNDWPVANH